MQTVKKMFFLNQRQILSLEYFAFGEWYMFELVFADIEDALYQVEVHVFVHVCLLQTLASHTGPQKQTRLDVNAVPPVLLPSQALLKKCTIALLVATRRHKLIHLLLAMKRRQLMKLLEGQSLQCRSIGLLGINNQPRFEFHLGFVSSYQSLLQPSSKDNILRRGLVILKGKRQLVVEIIMLSHCQTKYSEILQPHQFVRMLSPLYISQFPSCNIILKKNMNISILEHALKNGSYYYIINRELSTQVPMALTYISELAEPKLCFQELDQTSHNQVWMIEQVKSNKYQLVHAYSTLVLAASKTEAWMGKGNWNSNQLFFVQKSDPKNNPFEHWIRESKESQQYLQFQTRLKCCQSNPKASKCRWQFKKITSQNQIFNSSLIQFAYSGLYLDLPGASLKPGASVIQYRLNSRCNQRWKLTKTREEDDSYMIISVRSKMCLTVKGDRAQGGTPVIQDAPSKALGQQWLLAHQGLSLYIIQSKLKKGLYLGIDRNSMDEEAALVLGTKQQYAFWRILGTFNQKQ